MNKLFSRILMTTLCLMLLCAPLTGCSGEKTALDAKHPITLSLWHLYGKNTDSPMNDLIDEFNHTVGRERGIIINVSNVTNALEVTQQLSDALAEAPGAPDIPDMVFGHPSNVIDTDASRFLDWTDVFTREDLSGYVDSFLEEGYIDGRLLVFPVSKSINVLFVNSGIFERFAADTGCTYEDLSTWDGFYETAAAYSAWSDGKFFCSFDYIFNTLRNDAVSLDEPFITEDNWLNFDCASFRKGWMRFAKAALLGQVKMAAPFSTTDMLCGDAVCGIGSSAAILYFGDEVIYPDNHTEPLDLKILPLPYEAGSDPAIAQWGAGLAALKSEDTTPLAYADGTVSDAKAEACGIFAAWLTEGERNLDFTAKIGYMPVTKEGLAAVRDYAFDTPVQKELQEVMAEVVETRQLYIPAYLPEFDTRLSALYDVMRDTLDTCRSRYLAGGDLDLLAEQTWEAMQ